jgi:hypothetical protein
MGIPISATTLALIGTWAAVGGTLALMYWQTIQAQKLNSANAVITLRERFDSADMRAARRQLAKALVSGDPNAPASMEVPRFFELIGYLTNRKILDDELVWDAFGGWVTGYWTLLRSPHDRIGIARQEYHDHLIFAKFEWLSDRMHRLDALNLGEPEPHLDVLVAEAKLLLGHEAAMDDLSS